MQFKKPGSVNPFIWAFKANCNRLPNHPCALSKDGLG